MNKRQFKKHKKKLYIKSYKKMREKMSSELHLATRGDPDFILSKILGIDKNRSVARQILYKYFENMYKQIEEAESDEAERGDKC